MKGIILEQISRADCLFISDLRDAGKNPVVVASLKTINWRNYSFDECNYALSYISGKKVLLQSYEEIDNFVGEL